ncbi:MAG: hypothetical protein ACTSWX_02325 [Promethearchaeota archaeon]
MSSDDNRELAEKIRKNRQLPYTITIEKREGDKIITHNIWGNTVIYKELEDGNYEVLNYSD